MKRALPQSLITLVAVTTAPGASAHTFGAHGAGLVAGLAHPLTGIDHLLAMTAVGLWATRVAPRQLWAVPLAFLVMLAGGAALGMAGGELPWMEPLISASVLVVGLLLALNPRVPPAIAALISATCALAHGYAHGAELPEAATPLAYALGFMLTTAALHAAGIGLGLTLGAARIWTFRVSGLGIAAVGVWLLSSA